jgi:gamma-glutamyltranspeptidase/glutathione hydrolase
MSLKDGSWILFQGCTAHFSDGLSSLTGQVKVPETIMMEPGFPYETIRALENMGHGTIIHGVPGLFGGYQCIQFDPVHKVYFGASDPRKDGMAAGY